MKSFALLLIFGYVSFGNTVELFEGDIVLDPMTRYIVEGDGDASFAYDAMVSRKWPGGVVPYVFDRGFDNARRQAVQKAIADYSRYTCVKFVQRSNQPNYLRFIVGGGCYSNIGVQGGSQDISIGRGCERHGTVIHEMMHAVGFFHEQSRRDRDDHVNIYWNNIQSGMDYNFKKYAHGEADTLNYPYDLDSVMHYEKYAFSKNRQPTIVAKSNPNRQLGQHRGFSEIDIKQINALYQCKSSGGDGGHVCTDNDNNCQWWASRGECNKNPDYMLVNCRKSCRQC